MFTDQVYNVWYSTNNESKIMKEKKRKILTMFTAGFLFLLIMR